MCSRTQTTFQCGHCDITLNNFKILGSASEEVDLRILGSIFIFKRRPFLNNMESVFPLLIVIKLFLAKPSQSAIRDHFEQCGHCDITVDNFKILGNIK